MWVLIGWLIDNLCLYVFDCVFRLQFFGVVGELYIGGVGVVCGYLNWLELNVECFFVDFFVVGGCFYCIGDLVCWLVDGNFEYFGCVDDQVKICGNWVEFDEVCDCFVVFFGVCDVVVVVCDLVVCGMYLVGYYVVVVEFDFG